MTPTPTPTPGSAPAPADKSRRDSMAARLAESGPAMLLYGAIVASMALAISASHSEFAGQVVLAISGALVVYWLSHVYVMTLAEHLSDPTTRTAALVAESLRKEGLLLVGGFPTLAVFSVSYFLFSAQLDTAAYVALWTTAALLAVVGNLAGHASGARGWRLAAETAVAAAFGLAAVGLKALLH